MASILVTTADGPEGTAMVTALLAASTTSAPVRVVAGVAEPSSAAARKLAGLGAELRRVSSPPEPAEFGGVDWVFVLAPLTADRYERGRLLIRAARAGGVRSAALLSVIGAGDASVPASLAAYAALEERLRSEWPAERAVVFRTYFYQQNLLFWAADVERSGAFRLPLSATASCYAPLYEADVAAVLKVIMSTGIPQPGPGGAVPVLNLTGPSSLSGSSLARVASRVLGTALQFEVISRNASAAILEATGALDASEAALLLDLLELQTGAGSCAMWPSPDVRRIIGRDPTGIDSFFAEHASAFRPKGGRYWS